MLDCSPWQQLKLFPLTLQRSVRPPCRDVIKEFYDLARGGATERSVKCVALLLRPDYSSHHQTSRFRPHSLSQYVYAGFQTCSTFGLSHNILYVGASHLLKSINNLIQAVYPPAL